MGNSSSSPKNSSVGKVSERLNVSQRRPRVAQHLLQGAASPWAASWGHGDALELFEECLVCLATACWGTLTSSGTELENLEREAGRLGTSAKSATGYMRHTSWCLPSLPPSRPRAHARFPQPFSSIPRAGKGQTHSLRLPVTKSTTAALCFQISIPLPSPLKLFDFSLHHC